MIIGRSVRNAVANTMEMPFHRTGDIIFMAAVGQTAPVIPNSAGWQALVTIGTSGFFLTLARKIAFYDNNESVGTFTNAILMSCVVYGSSGALGLMGENWGNRQQIGTTARLMNFSPVNRSNHDFSNFLPMHRVCAVAVNSNAPGVLESDPAVNWTFVTRAETSSPIAARLAFFDSAYFGGTFDSIDFTHQGGNVANRSIGTACFETNSYITGTIGRTQNYYTGLSLGAY